MPISGAKPPPSPAAARAPSPTPPTSAPILTHELTLSYTYKHVTESVAREWNKEGVCPSALLQAANHAWKAYVEGGGRAGGMALKRVLLELVSQTAATLLKTETTVQFLHVLLHNICSKEEEKEGGEEGGVEARKQQFWRALADTLGTAYLQVGREGRREGGRKGGRKRKGARREVQVSHHS